MPNRQTIALVPALLLALATIPLVATIAVAAPPAPVEKGAQTQTDKSITPPRLSYTDGDVSFWRPGAEDWTPSRLNTPLAAGDRLYAGEGGSLEVELGGQAYVRGGEQTQIGVANLEPDFTQIEVTSGQASLDVRSLPAGHTIEVDTPNAAFTVENTGYYRIDVDEDQTTFITRRGGQARVTPAGGKPAAVSPTEQVVVRGTQTPVVETYVAPELDSWDRWNYARTDRIVESLSARYVPAGVAGTSDLDYYGRWRVVPTYGPVWVPTTVTPGWVPYSAGRWVWDPYYHWTWVDDAPWGWAPYHYGRWVYYDGFWAWAPGPLVVRPVYAPALVAFYGGSNFGISVSFGGPAVGWAPLGWGEPCVPWWGPWYGTFWWGGWGGPHHRYWHHDDWGDDDHHHHDGDWDDDHHGHDGDWDNHGHRRTFGDGRDDGDDGQHRRTVIVEPEGEFGRGRGEGRRVTQVRGDSIEPIRGKPPVKVSSASLTPGLGRGTRPPDPIAARPVVATRTPHDPAKPLREAGLSIPKGGAAFAPRSEVVKAPKLDLAPTAAMPPRPPFGKSGTGEREEPPPPPGAPRRGGKGVSGEGGADVEGPQMPKSDRKPAAAPDVAQRGGSRGGSAAAAPDVTTKPKSAAPPRAWRRSAETPQVQTSRGVYQAPPVPDGSGTSTRRGGSYGGSAYGSQGGQGGSRGSERPRSYSSPGGAPSTPSGGSRGYGGYGGGSVPQAGSSGRGTAPSYGTRGGGSPSYGTHGGGSSAPGYGAPSGRGVGGSAPAGPSAGAHGAGSSGRSLPGVPANQTFGGPGVGGRR